MEDGDFLDRVTEVANALAGAALETFSNPPFKFTTKVLRLVSRPAALTELPVVLSQRFEGALKIWVTMSMDLSTALSIADRSLKASGSYAMGFSNTEQAILKNGFKEMSALFLNQLKDRCSPLAASGLRLSFGQRIATAPKTWMKPLLVELGFPRAAIQVDLAIHPASQPASQPAGRPARQPANLPARAVP